MCAADGNPNEENVGAFGVGNRDALIMLVDSHKRIAGFYSVFSVTEEPLVTSGGIFNSFRFLRHILTGYSRPVDAILLEG